MPAVFRGLLLSFSTATTAGRSVPLPSAEPLGAADSTFFGKAILRFVDAFGVNAAFGLVCFCSISSAPWSKTLSFVSSDSICSAILAACAKVLDEKGTGYS